MRRRWVRTIRIRDCRSANESQIPNPKSQRPSASARLRRHRRGRRTVIVTANRAVVRIERRGLVGVVARRLAFPRGESMWMSWHVKRHASSTPDCDESREQRAPRAGAAPTSHLSYVADAHGRQANRDRRTPVAGRGALPALPPLVRVRHRHDVLGFSGRHGRRSSGAIAARSRTAAIAMSPAEAYAALGADAAARESGSTPLTADRSTASGWAARMHSSTPTPAKPPRTVSREMVRPHRVGVDAAADRRRRASTR